MPGRQFKVVARAELEVTLVPSAQASRPTVVFSRMPSLLLQWRSRSHLHLQQTVWPCGHWLNDIMKVIRVLELKRDVQKQTITWRPDRFYYALSLKTCFLPSCPEKLADTGKSVTSGLLLCLNSMSTPGWDPMLILRVPPVFSGPVALSISFLGLLLRVSPEGQADLSLLACLHWWYLQ